MLNSHTTFEGMLMSMATAIDVVEMLLKDGMKQHPEEGDEDVEGLDTTQLQDDLRTLAIRMTPELDATIMSLLKQPLEAVE